MSASTESPKGRPLAMSKPASPMWVVTVASSDMPDMMAVVATEHEDVAEATALAIAEDHGMTDVYILGRRRVDAIQDGRNGLACWATPQPE